MVWCGVVCCDAHDVNGVVAQMYHDLDGGFTPLNFVFPYFPIPSVFKREKAKEQMRELFLSIMKNRRYGVGVVWSGVNGVGILTTP